MAASFDRIAAWCFDAHKVLSIDLPDRISELRLSAIERHANDRGIIEIAKDLAEGLSHQPEPIRSSAARTLSEAHGFGPELFLHREKLTFLKVLARGSIRGEKEYRLMLDAVSDTTLDQKLAAAASAVIESYEAVAGNR